MKWLTVISIGTASHATVNNCPQQQQQQQHLHSASSLSGFFNALCCGGYRLA